MSQERLHVRRPHVPRMSGVMKFDIPPHPMQVHLLSSICQVTRANLFARHFEQAAPFRHIISSKEYYATNPQSDPKEIRKMSIDKVGPCLRLQGRRARPVSR